MIGPKIQVLDHGYIQFIEAWGSDQRIIEAARMSTDKGFLGWGPTHKYTCPVHGVVEAYHVTMRDGDIGREAVHMNCPSPGVETACDVDTKSGDEKLLKYLYDNKHATPFEFAGMVIEIQAPIFVFREWHRHRTQAYNEMSARYTPLPDLNYIPTVERLLMGGGHLTRQAGSTGAILTSEKAVKHQGRLERVYALDEEIYQEALADGVPKELARIHLPLARYSRMRAVTSVRNWLGFLTLRMDSKAQWEIREYANETSVRIKENFPRTWDLFAAGNELPLQCR